MINKIIQFIKSYILYDDNPYFENDINKLNNKFKKIILKYNCDTWFINKGLYIDYLFIINKNILYVHYINDVCQVDNIIDKYKKYIFSNYNYILDSCIINEYCEFDLYNSQWAMGDDYDDFYYIKTNKNLLMFKYNFTTEKIKKVKELTVAKYDDYEYYDNWIHMKPFIICPNKKYCNYMKYKAKFKVCSYYNRYYINNNLNFPCEWEMAIAQKSYIYKFKYRIIFLFI